MTSIESGTAVNQEYVPEETRAVAIHEAGHAVCAHVYMRGTESTRLSIRKRGRSLGHHQALEKEERFSSWRHEEMGRLTWTLGAMAAERVFYGENSTGVGGDVQSATARAAWMVGSCAMAPEPIDLSGFPGSDDEEDEARKGIEKRFQRIGTQIMNRSGSGGPFQQDPIAGVLGDADKRAMAAQLLGQAYMRAHLLIEANREAVDRIADRPRRATGAPRRRGGRAARQRPPDGARRRSDEGRDVADPVEPAVTDTGGPGTAEAEPEPPPPAPSQLAGPARSQPARGYGKRFLLVYLVLGLVLGVAIGGLVVVLSGPGQTPEASWSVWQPEGDNSQKAQQIATHVSGAYRLPSGQQLVGIQPAPPRVQDVPLGAIAVRRLPGVGETETPVNVFDVEGVVVYILCGLGENCAIEEGEPSAERLRLLRRESLELALYTFRYLDDVSSVVTFLPPRPGDEPSFALLFERGDLDSQLERPLRATLPDSPPVAPENLAPLEVETIDRLTSANFFRFSFQQLQDGTAVLVLDDPRLPEQTPSTETAAEPSRSPRTARPAPTDGGTQTEGGTTTTGSADEAGAQAQ